MATLTIPAVVTTPPPAAHYELADGDAGTSQTLALMSDLVNDAKGAPRVIATARRITQHVKSFDPLGQARAVYRWVKHNIRFRNDPTGIETLSTVDVTLDQKSGDCDDFAVLICSLLESLGIDCSFVAAATNPAAPDTYTHVWPEARIKGKWIALDAARPGAAFGRRPDPRRTYRAQRVTLGQLGQLGALAGFGDDTSLVAATGTSIADIIAAGNPQSSYTAVNYNAATGGGLGPYGVAPGGVPGASATVTGSSSTILLVGGALLLVLLMSRR